VLVTFFFDDCLLLRVFCSVWGTTRRLTGDVTRLHQAVQPKACVECTNGASALTAPLSCFKRSNSFSIKIILQASSYLHLLGLTRAPNYVR
jgi:hypothetical protein